MAADLRVAHFLCSREQARAGIVDKDVQPADGSARRPGTGAGQKSTLAGLILRKKIGPIAPQERQVKKPNANRAPRAPVIYGLRSRK